MKDIKEVNVDAVCEKAAEHFLSGWNCAEAVYLAVCEDIDPDKKDLVNLMTGLGYGMGRSGLVCGALTGAVITTGIFYGRKRLDKRQEVRSYKVSRELTQKFKEQFEHTDCGDLLKRSGCVGGKEKSCPELVRKATRFALEALSGVKKPASK